jgi:hypothetical protein
VRFSYLALVQDKKITCVLPANACCTVYVNCPSDKLFLRPSIGHTKKQHQSYSSAPFAYALNGKAYCMVRTVREYRRGNEKGTIQRRWHQTKKNKAKNYHNIRFAVKHVHFKYQKAR